MADDMDEKHGTSDEYVDPYCDICFEIKGLNVRVYGYCKDCFQFLCSKCHVFHEKFQVTKSHVILQGSSMPQSQADKPPRYHHCDDHPVLVKDQFCCEHKNVICSSCSASHTNCIVQSIEDVCKNISSSETDSLYYTVKTTLQDQARATMLSVEANIKKLNEQKISMLKEAQNLHGNVILKVNKLFQDIQSNIEANCQSQILLMSQHKEKINAIIAKLDSSMTDIEKFHRKPIDTKLFLKIQDNVTDTNQITGEFRSLYESMLLVNLSFIPSEIVKDFLSASFTLGSISKSQTKPCTNIVVNDLVFSSTIKPPKKLVTLPQQSSGYTTRGTALLTRPVLQIKVAKQTSPISQMHATKQCSYEVKLNGGEIKCDIAGMAITKDGRILMADNGNSNVKMFSHDMEFLSSVTVPDRPWHMFLSSDSASDRPWDIAVISDEEAAVTTSNKSLVLLDTSGTRLHIKVTIKVPYDIRGITKYKNKLIVSSGSHPASVKLIDMTGKVYWSVPSDKRGQSLFRSPSYLTSHDEGRSSTVIVTDWCNNMLTLLNGDTGDVITRRQSQRIKPKSVTTDTVGNVYVCNYWTKKVSVLSEDLSEEKILLSTQDGLSDYPQAIVYDDKTHQLLIAYFDTDIVDSFKLS